MLNLSKKFLNAFSVSGLEHSLSSLIQSELASVSDDSFIDAMGNLFVLRKGKDHSKKNPTRNQPVMLTLSRRDEALAIQRSGPPVSACAENPLAGFTL